MHFEINHLGADWRKKRLLQYVQKYVGYLYIIKHSIIMNWVEKSQ